MSETRDSEAQKGERTIEVEGGHLFLQVAGDGPGVVLIHPGLWDSRTWDDQWEPFAARHRVARYDVRGYGRSSRPAGEPYSHVRDLAAVMNAAGLERAALVGCSMGGAIVLKLAVDCQQELRGIIGLESSAFAPGRYNDFLHHPAIHGGELAASYTYGLCAPQSPESSARENWWYYSQAGPGVYAGDVHFYSIDWDGREEIKTIDTSVCKVSLLTGEYDYSCTPDMTRQVAAAIPGARLVIMKGIGHFPMIENYPLFRGYLLPELDVMRERR